MDLRELIQEASSPLGLLVFLGFMNLFTFLLFGIDKWFAIKGLYRVSERNLFLSSLLGGSIGGVLGMFVFRHKLRKGSFKVTMLLILLIQFVGIAWLTFRNNPFLNQSA